MKNLKIIFALFILSTALYSCDSTVTVDDPKNETIEEVSTKTGSQGNEVDDRDNG